MARCEIYEYCNLLHQNRPVNLNMRCVYLHVNETTKHCVCVCVCVLYLLALWNIIFPSICGLQCREDVSIQSAVQSQIPQTGTGQDAFPLQDVA